MRTWAAHELEPLVTRLAPYAHDSFERAAGLAARLHAEEISPEHWLAALLADEGCAATRAVLHAFADPETIGVEVLALCSGIMVVGSDRTLPFSVLGVEALRTARAGAAARAGTRVEPIDLFVASERGLVPELRARLAHLPGAVLEPGLPPAPGARDETLPTTGPLFRHFSASGLRALGCAGRAAAALGRDAIGPAHIVLGTLEVDAELCASTALTPGRARMACSGLDEDRTPLPERRLGGDERLRALLEEVPPGAGTLEVVAWMLARGSEELIALLRRQKVTTALLERCRGVYQDPPPEPSPETRAR